MLTAYILQQHISFDLLQRRPNIQCHDAKLALVDLYTSVSKQEHP